MPDSDSPPRRSWTVWAAAAIALGAVALPPRTLAVALVGQAAPTLTEVVRGVWILKVALLVNAGIIWFAGHFPFGSGAKVDRRLDVPGSASWSSHAVAVALLVLVAAALRLHALGDGLWLDEIATLVNYVQTPLGHTISTFRDTNQHAFYSLSAKATTSLFGFDAWALRLPAALYGVASVAALYWFARPIVGSVEALASSALLTFSYHHVWFSQDARGYTALLLCTLLSTGIYLRMMRGMWTGWGAATAYGVVMAFGLYTHLSAIAVFMAHGLIWLWMAVARGQRDQTSVRTAGAGLAVGASVALLLHAIILPQLVNLLLFRKMQISVGTEWKQPAWLAKEMIVGLSRGLPGGALALVAGGTLLGVGLASLFRRSQLLGWLLVLPPAIVLTLIVALSHNLWPRFFFFSAGFGVLILMRGVFATTTALMPRWGRGLASGVALALVLVSATTVPAAWGPKQDFVGAAEYVEGAAAPGDAIVTVGYTRLPYIQYLGKPWASVESYNELLQIEETHDRTWLLYILPAQLRTAQPEIWGRLRREYRLGAEFAGTLNGGEVAVMLHEGAGDD
jgi:mannosyltransferase